MRASTRVRPRGRGVRSAIVEIEPDRVLFRIKLVIVLWVGEIVVSIKINLLILVEVVEVFESFLKLRILFFFYMSFSLIN